jgi:hypothetical protein
MLKARLYELELQKREEKANAVAACQDRYRLGPPDPLLRAAALSDGEGPAHRAVVIQGGDVRPGDAISVTLPDGPHRALVPV